MEKEILLKDYIETADSKEVLFDIGKKVFSLEENFEQTKEELFDAIETISLTPGDKGDKGDDGKTPTPEELVSLIKPLIPAPKNGKDGSPDTPKEIKTKLETLKGEERLSAYAIKDLEYFTRSLGNVIGGANTFVQLTDTPKTYLGAAGYMVRVNSGMTGLEFAPFTPTSPGGSNGSVQYNNGGTFGGFGNWNGDDTFSMNGNYFIQSIGGAWNYDPYGDGWWWKVTGVANGNPTTSIYADDYTVGSDTGGAVQGSFVQLADDYLSIDRAGRFHVRAPYASPYSTDFTINIDQYGATTEKYNGRTVNDYGNYTQYFDVGGFGSDYSIYGPNSSRFILSSAGGVDLRANNGQDIYIQNDYNTNRLNLYSNGAIDLRSTNGSDMYIQNDNDGNHLLLLGGGSTELSAANGGNLTLTNAGIGSYIQLDSGGAINILSVNGTDLSLQSQTSGNINLTSGNDINLTAAAGNTITAIATGGITITANNGQDAVFQNSSGAVLTAFADGSIQSNAAFGGENRQYGGGGSLINQDGSGNVYFYSPSGKSLFLNQVGDGDTHARNAFYFDFLTGLGVRPLGVDGSGSVVTGLYSGYLAKSTNYTLANSDGVVNATTSGITLTLPSASAQGETHIIKNSSSGTVTVAVHSGDTIFTTSAVTTVTLSIGSSLKVICTNANSWIAV